MNGFWRIAPWIFTFLLGSLFSLALTALFNECSSHPDLKLPKVEAEDPHR
jgi:hypothetical protein